MIPFLFGAARVAAMVGRGLAGAGRLAGQVATTPTALRGYRALGGGLQAAGGYGGRMVRGAGRMVGRMAGGVFRAARRGGRRRGPRGGGRGGGGVGRQQLRTGLQALGIQSTVSARMVQAMGVSVAGIPKAIQLFGSALTNNAKQFQAFNGQIAASIAQLESRRIGRTIQMGAARADSTKFMVQSLDKLEAALMPYANVFANLLNTAVGYMAVLATGVLQFVSSVGGSLKGLNPQLDKIIESLEKMAGGNASGMQHFPGKGFAPPVLSDMYKLLDQNRGSAGKQNVPQPQAPLVQQIPQKRRKP